jgi:hypothetical protein
MRRDSVITAPWEHRRRWRAFGASTGLWRQSWTSGAAGNWRPRRPARVGYGGVSVMARATGLARSTIHASLRDLQVSRQLRVRAAERIRRTGAGRPPLTTRDPALLTALLALSYCLRLTSSHRRTASDAPALVGCSGSRYAGRSAIDDVAVASGVT